MATEAHRGTIVPDSEGGTRRRLVVAGLAALVALAIGAFLIAWSADDTVEAPPASHPEAGAPAEGARAGQPTEEPSPVVGPFEIDDLDALVLQPEDGEGLVRGLEYSASYSGTADLDDLHHWTLVPVDPIGEAGFVTAEGSLFMTPEFLSSFAGEGQDLLTAAILFETPDGARRAYRVFASSRDRVWEEWRPLPMKHGRGQEGLLGSDNVSVVYPTVGFMGRVGNVVVLTGSQGGSERGEPLPAILVRDLTVELLARARTALRGG